MSEPSDDELREIFDELQQSYNAMLGAAFGELETPHTFETSVSGSRAESEGSIRHICDYIGEQDGYQATYEFESEATSLPEHEERYRFEITITED